jgi:hypothetical protein
MPRRRGASSSARRKQRHCGEGAAATRRHGRRRTSSSDSSSRSRSTCNTCGKRSSRRSVDSKIKSSGGAGRTGSGGDGGSILGPVIPEARSAIRDPFLDVRTRRPMGPGSPRQGPFGRDDSNGLLATVATQRASLGAPQPVHATRRPHLRDREPAPATARRP